MARISLPSYRWSIWNWSERSWLVRKRRSWLLRSIGARRRTHIGRRNHGFRTKKIILLSRRRSELLEFYPPPTTRQRGLGGIGGCERVPKVSSGCCCDRYG